MRDVITTSDWTCPLTIDVTCPLYDNWGERLSLTYLGLSMGRPNGTFYVRRSQQRLSHSSSLSLSNNTGAQTTSGSISRSASGSAVRMATALDRDGGHLGEGSWVVNDAMKGVRMHGRGLRL